MIEVSTIFQIILDFSGYPIYEELRKRYWPVPHQTSVTQLFRSLEDFWRTTTLLTAGHLRMNKKKTLMTLRSKEYLLEEDGY